MQLSASAALTEYHGERQQTGTLHLPVLKERGKNRKYPCPDHLRVHHGCRQLRDDKPHGNDDGGTFSLQYRGGCKKAAEGFYTEYGCLEELALYCGRIFKGLPEGGRNIKPPGTVRRLYGAHELYAAPQE